MFARILPKIAVVLMVIGLIASSNVWSGFGRHGHVFHGFHGYHGHHRYYRSPGYRGYYGSPGYHGYSGYAYAPYHARGANDMGALDLNVKPKSTQVYLNGQYIGRTDRFDGFPDYLWLREGVHQVTFYHQGYQTVVRELEIHPGLVIDVRFRLEPGESAPPEGPILPEPAGEEPGDAVRNQENGPS